MLEERPHSIVDTVAELRGCYVVLESGGQVAEHRIVRRQRHQIRRVGGHYLVLAPVQIVERNVHVQRRADIQADRQAVQLAHDDIFQAAAHQLLARAEDFGADESGHIVQVDPRRGFVPRLPRFGHLLCERASKPCCAIRESHIEAVAVAVGEVGALAGLKVQTELTRALRGVPEHLLQADVEGLVGLVAAGNALEPQGRAAGERALDLRLDIDVSQHTVRQDIVDAERDQQFLERPLDRLDRQWIADTGLVPSTVADGNDQPSNTCQRMSSTGWASWADPRAEIAFGADPAARQRIEDFGTTAVSPRCSSA
jgi:hypothetical protein